MGNVREKLLKSGWNILENEEEGMVVGRDFPNSPYGIYAKVADDSDESLVSAISRIYNIMYVPKNISAALHTYMPGENEADILLFARNIKESIEHLNEELNEEK